MTATIYKFPDIKADMARRHNRSYELDLQSAPLMDEYRPSAAPRHKSVTPTPLGWFLIGCAICLGVGRR
jgi:hypothetical protein